MQNLIFSGLNHDQNEPACLVDAITNFCLHKLGVAVTPNRAHRIGSGQKGIPDVIANFAFESEVKEILQNAHKLKGTPFFISRDYVGPMKKVNNALGKFRIALRKKQVQVKIGMNTLFFKGYKYSVTTEGEFMLHGQCGCVHLSGLVGFNVGSLWDEAWAGKKRSREEEDHAQVVSDQKGDGRRTYPSNGEKNNVLNLNECDSMEEV